MATQEGDSGLGGSGLGGSMFILHEAECSDQESDNENCIENVVENDFINDANVNQGNSLEVFQALSNKQDDEILGQLKRKYAPAAECGGRVLQPVDTNCPPAKRRLFPAQVPQETVSRHEALCTAARHQVHKENAEGNLGQISAILRSSNLIATLLARFKLVVGIGWRELTREFKNNRSTTTSWVVACFEVHETVFESARELLKKYCEYYLCRRYVHETFNVCLYLCEFKTAKCKVTVHGVFKTILGVEQNLILAEPPKLRSGVCAMYWFKCGFTQGCYKYGHTPDWLLQQTVLGHKSASEPSKFDLTVMVQWAYDQDYTEASDIAYNYALEASQDANAAAWLASASQAKYVRDCEAMVRYYKRAELSQMTMSEYVYKQCRKCSNEGTWLEIMNFFQHQGIEPVRFVSAMKDWLKGTPKKNTIFFIGPPNTGKSMLTNSLMKFLGGRVLSFAMSKSTFWMQPLTTCKAALIDDATVSCLNYFDSHLRNILDGYPVCIDRKYKSAIEIKAPPLMVTTNIDIHSEPRYFYLRSRAVCFYFNNEVPVDENGNPVFNLTNANWTNFFTRLWARLGLEEQNASEDGSDRPFNILNRTGNGPD